MVSLSDFREDCGRRIGSQGDDANKPFGRSAKMKTLILTVLATPLLALVIAGSAAAHAAGTISGIVTDRATGSPVEGALVILLPDQDSTFSSADGSFEFSSVSPGSYSLQIEHHSFETFIVGAVSVKKGEYVSSPVVLTPLAGSAKIASPRPIITVPDEPQPVDIDQGDYVFGMPDMSELQSTQQRTGNDRPAEIKRRPKASPSTRHFPPPVDYKPYPCPRPWPTDMIFRDYGVSGFVQTRFDRLSTFAADVDDGSFDLARRYLHDGHLPARDAIRAEEFINHFDYGYETPDFAKFGVTSIVRPSPFDDSTSILLVGMKGREIDRRERKPVNLTFVIDVSGSMGYDNRLEIVKYALRELVDQLGRHDRVGIVTYGSGAGVLLEPTPAMHRHEILRAIDRLRPGGSTNAEAGLRLGYRMAERQYVSGHSNRIILCSDGAWVTTMMSFWSSSHSTATGDMPISMIAGRLTARW
jgi:hypothetical protein